VVGHAFRTCQPASYFRLDGASSLILAGQTMFDWILAFPIRVSPDGPPIGAVAFAGRNPEDWSRDLRDYAQRAADLRRLEQRLGSAGFGASDKATAARLVDFEGRLVQSASILFWHGVRHVISKLGEANTDTYREIFQTWIEGVRRTASTEDAPERRGARAARTVAPSARRSNRTALRTGSGATPSRRGR
jgi:hypothetical protein